MGTEIRKFERRQKIKEEIQSLVDSPNVLVIHYSSESFYDRPHGRTHRVTSIAVQNFASGQTESFSIHKIAELSGVESSKIDSKYDMLEKKMLTDFFDFVKCHGNHRWVHWNMRDINYGFAALEHRFRILGEEPLVIGEKSKFDLSRALVSLFGTKYIGHPRLINLVKLNGMTDRDLLTGKEEADAFEAKEYVKMHQSTLRKVDVLSNILRCAEDGTLKTKACWLEIHGTSPKLIVEKIREHWVVSVLLFILTSVVFIVGLLESVQSWVEH